MKTITNLLFILAAAFHIAAAEETKRDYGFKLSKDLRVDGYDFEFTKAEPDKDHWRMGYFKFRWNGTHPVRLWGFGFEKDGSFRVRFEEFSKMAVGQWKEVAVGYCGTGAEMFTLEPNKDYVLRVPLWPYQKDGEEGVIKLSGEEISLVSAPFKIAGIRGKDSNNP